MQWFIPHIRFPIIDKDYFFDKIEKSGLICYKDLNSISKYFIHANILTGFAMIAKL